MRRTAGRHTRKGIALIAALIFIAVFMAASAGMLAMSSQNSIAASNLHTANAARSTAESGLELVRYWMRDISIPATTSAGNRYQTILDQFEDALTQAGIGYQSDNDTIYVGSAQSPIVIDADTNRSFYAIMNKDALTDRPHFQIIGMAGQLTRRLDVGFSYGVRPHTVFDYGVATKGPLMLVGNTALDGVTLASESDVYIESLADNHALSVEGNSQIAGKVSIVNPDAEVTLKGGQSSIGGERDLTHVDTGVNATEFPYPNTDYFKDYATGGYYTGGDTLENVIIAADTNPTFTDVTIKGVLYIESPNVVDFGGNVNITGLIVGDGDMYDHSETNQMIFRGNVSSQSASELPQEPQFDGLRDETGTFLMAPGFSLSFGGNFGTVNGAIVGNGIEFFGNAGGTIEGSVINYSPNPMTVTGNSDLYFNRSGIEKLPAGFEQEILVHYFPASYTEVASGF